MKRPNDSFPPDFVQMISDKLTNKKRLDTALQLYEEGSLSLTDILSMDQLDKVIEAQNQRKNTEAAEQRKREIHRQTHAAYLSSCERFYDSTNPQNKNGWRIGYCVYVKDGAIVEIHEEQGRQGGCVWAKNPYYEFHWESDNSGIIKAIQKEEPALYDKIQHYI